MGTGDHFVDENLTNYGDYACSTDGVNMNTPNQACISKLELESLPQLTMEQTLLK